MKSKFKNVVRLVLNFIKSYRNSYENSKFLKFTRQNFDSLLNDYRRITSDDDEESKITIFETNIKDDFRYLNEIFILHHLFNGKNLNELALQKLKTIFLIFLNNDPLVNLITVKMRIKLTDFTKKLQGFFKKDYINENEMFNKLTAWHKCKLLKTVLNVKFNLIDYLLFFYSNFIMADTKPAIKISDEKLQHLVTNNLNQNDESPLLNIKWEQFEFKPINQNMSRKVKLKSGARMKISSINVIYEYLKVNERLNKNKDIKKEDQNNTSNHSKTVKKHEDPVSKVLVEKSVDKTVYRTVPTSDRNELRNTKVKNESEKRFFINIAKLLAEKGRNKSFEKHKEELLKLALKEYSKVISGIPTIANSVTANTVTNREKIKPINRRECLNSNFIEKTYFMSKIHE